MLLLLLRRRFWPGARTGARSAGTAAFEITPQLERFLDRMEKLYGSIEGAISSATDPTELAMQSKRRAQYQTLVESYRRLVQSRKALEALRTLREAERDAAMRQLVEEEMDQLSISKQEQELHIRGLLLAPDQDDQSGAILEVRAGTGGTEASLFAGELLRMYERYCRLHNWSFEPASLSTEGTEGIREATINISGRGVFGRLKYESGVHRIQRVPRTESAGRVHTSTTTVAILPQVDEIVVEIAEKDLRIDSFKSSGPGGQHVNKTNSAVRVVHLPTGIAVAVQEERCAQQNRLRAMAILRARLYDQQRQAQETSRRSARQSQIGRAERSDKVRTYNMPQNRITDHRIGLSLHDPDAFFAGITLDTFIDALQLEWETHRLAELESAEDGEA